MKLRHKIIAGIVSLIPGLSQTSIPAIDDGKTTSPKFKELCRAAARESIVMVRNDGTLPLNKNTKIAIFGRCQINYFFCGYGSGGDVKAPYKINVLEGFREAGAKLNEDLVKFYEETCAKDVPYDGFWGAWPYHYDEFKLEDSFVE
jgi:beta-glucosidase